MVSFLGPSEKYKTENRSVVARSGSWKVVLALKEAEEIPWGEGTVLYCGGGYTIVWLCQTSQDYKG